MYPTTRRAAALALLFTFALLAPLSACAEGEKSISTKGSETGDPQSTSATGSETEDQKIIYTMGLALARNLTNLSLSAEEVTVLVSGLEDGISGREPKFGLAEYAPKIPDLAKRRQAAAASVELEASKALLEAAAAEKGATKTESGLVILELEPGSGKAPQATDTVKVHYHGTLRDGTVFDSSVVRGEPATFPLDRVIPCWSEAVQKMSVGEKAKITCPSAIAYGDRGAPPHIKPGAALVFEVQLLEIVQK